ncbi:MAG: hypothetical protein FJ387_13585 [Verrucomicrobia bacterium]|nr:hypothetical protein [Verrucomicrobiota bacterium]
MNTSSLFARLSHLAVARAERRPPLAARPLPARGVAQFLAVAVLLGGVSGQAQWLTQSLDLKAGWNAVYLHVDASHDTLENLVGADSSNPILEVWAWTPAPTTMQFVQSPQQPVDQGSQWRSWVRNSTDPQALERLVGNATYLVRVAENPSPYTWRLEGRPLTPTYDWTTTGLNFLGFPTVPTAPPNFDAFLAPAPALHQNVELYQYVGGELGSANPQRVYALRTTPVNRGQAYWIRAGDVYNRYFAPFELTGPGPDGVQFGAELSTASLRLRNLTAASLTVTLQLLASEPPPAGQPAIVDSPPLLVRGALNLTTLTHGYASLPAGGSSTWTLAPAGQNGSEAEVVLGLDRAAMTQSVGDQLAGVLRFTDSLGFAQVDLGVSATVGSRAGLWVGNAVVNQVGHYLKAYERDGAGNLTLDEDGKYVVTGVNTEFGAVPYPYSLRLIVHNPEVGQGNALLLQRVYVGANAAADPIVANRQSALNPALLSQARRISTPHLPWTAGNLGWAFDARLGSGQNLATIVTLNFDDHASNPFLHTYHPDHDNLDARFKNALAQGSESYTVERHITLTVWPPADDFANRTAAGQTLTGAYAESVRVLGLARAGGTYDTRTFEVRGGFALRRITALPTLTRVP